jgi:hypothetical protein
MSAFYYVFKVTQVNYLSIRISEGDGNYLLASGILQQDL